MRFPEVDRLRDSDTFRIVVTQDRSRGMISLVDSEGVFWTIDFVDAKGGPIEFEVGDLDIFLSCEEDSTVVTLGEYEFYTEVPDGWLHLEGDFGQFSFRCDKVIVTKHRQG